MRPELEKVLVGDAILHGRRLLLDELIPTLTRGPSSPHASLAQLVEKHLVLRPAGEEEVRAGVELEQLGDDVVDKRLWPMQR